MFIRERVVRGRTYYQAVEGYRDEHGRVRQRTFSVWGNTIEEALEDQKQTLLVHKRGRTTWKRRMNAHGYGQKEFDRLERKISETVAKIEKLTKALDVNHVDTTNRLTRESA